MWWTAIGAVVFLLPYVLAVAMPSWRWLVVCCVLVGGLLVNGFVGVVMSQEESGEGVLGILLLMGVAVPFGSGALIRAATLIMAARGWARRTVLEAHVLGLALPVGIVALAVRLRA
jgi:hypothetical protein